MAERTIGYPRRVTGINEKRIPPTPYIGAYALSEETLTVFRIIPERRRWPEDE